MIRVIPSVARDILSEPLVSLREWLAVTVAGSLACFREWLARRRSLRFAKSSLSFAAPFGLRLAALYFATAGATTLLAAERVVTLSPHLAELVCAAGGCDKLVGVVAWSDFPESVKKVAKVGDAWAVNPEQVLALQPDLVLAWDGGTPRETIERLRSLRLRVEEVKIARLDEVPPALRSIGNWLGTTAAAEKEARAYRQRLLQLRKAHARDAPVRVLYQIEANPPYSVNRDSPISEIIGICGGENLFADLPALAAPVEREAILARDPQAILYTKQDDVAAVEEFWKRAPAVSATRVHALYKLDGNLLDRATPRMLDGVEMVCAALSDARAKLLATAAPSRSSPAPAPAR